MRAFQGKSVFPGIAIGPLFVYRRTEQAIEKNTISDPEAEIVRYEAALKKAALQLRRLEEAACERIGEREAEIFKMHRLILEDETLTARIRAMIRRECCDAGHAVFVCSGQAKAEFLKMEDELMGSRAGDLQDVTRRLLAALGEDQAEPLLIKEPAILVAEDLQPSEILQLEKGKILALVTKGGSLYSHTAILARMMQIPCLVAADVDLSRIQTGQAASLDGEAGVLYLEPEDEVLSRLGRKAALEEEEKEQLAKLRGLPAVTKSGKRVRLYANVSGEPGESGEADGLADAEGIGLFRSEFQYMGRDEAPSEEELYETYAGVVRKMNGKPVVIRTLDLSGDKQVGYLQQERETPGKEPLQGIRYCLANRDLFATQLRAVLRATAHGNVSLMIPLVTSLEEVRATGKLLQEAKAELKSRGDSAGNPAFGIMIETPEAVNNAGCLAKEVEFFSIGTNDLTRLVLGMDRQEPGFEDAYIAQGETVLQMVEDTVRCAHQAGIPCGICGELATDLTVTERLVHMGVDQLSVAPAYILGLRRRIRELE